jgi:hypothetical protein
MAMAMGMELFLMVAGGRFHVSLNQVWEGSKLFCLFSSGQLVFTLKILK